MAAPIPPLVITSGVYRQLDASDKLAAAHVEATSGNLILTATSGIVQVAVRLNLLDSLNLARTSTAGNLSASEAYNIIGITNVGGSPIITLPGTPSGSPFYIIVDETGNASVGTPITVTTDNVNATINGVASKQITTGYGALRVYFNGVVYFTW
jgi:hypothetical protein